MADFEIIDVIFSALENKDHPMNMGALLVLREPDNAPLDFIDQTIAKIRSSDAPAVAPFNQVSKLISRQQLEKIDVDRHFLHKSLPKSSSVEDMLALVSKLHEPQLDKTKPLWELYVIDGIEDSAGKLFAIYFKLHHCLVDGIGGVQLIKNAFLSEKTAESVPLWAAKNKRLLRLAKQQLSIVKPASKPNYWLIAQQQMLAVKNVAKELSRTYLGKQQPHLIPALQAPATLFNKHITSDRSLKNYSFSIKRIQHIAKAYNVTTNDLFMAICSGALRKFLIAEDALPNKPLIAAVPFSLRTNASSAGNQLSLLLVNLATHIKDPIKRLLTISKSATQGKNRLNGLSKKENVYFTLASYGFLAFDFITGRVAKRQTFNVVITNMPGSKTPLYYFGAKVEQFVPLSVLLHGQAINFSVFSYLDSFSVSVISCPSVVKNTDCMGQLLENEIATLEAMIGDKIQYAI